MPTAKFKIKEAGDEFLNFHFNQKIGVHYKKDHIKVSQFTKFEVLLLDCNRGKGFQKSEKLETVVGFGGSHLRIIIRDICMEFGRPLTGHSLVSGYYVMKHNQTWLTY